MNRVQKRFLDKIKKPVLIYTGLLGSAVLIHYISTLWGYTLGHVIAYVGILIVYLGVPLLIVGASIVAFGIYICDKWQEAKQEVTQENGELIEVIRND